MISNLQSQTILYSPDTVNNSIYANSIEMNGNYLFVSGSLQSHPVARYVIYIYYLKDTIASLVDTFYDQEYNFDMVSSYGKYCAVAARSPLQSVGSVFMYHLENSKWNYLQKIAASDGTGANGFGNASIYRDEMIIGAPGDNVNGLGSGAAYIFKLQNGLWKEIQKLKPPDIQAGYHFGAPVKIYKDIAMVTASFANGMAGAVYVFRKTDTAWIQVQKIEHVGIGFENFGESIAIHNQFVLIGASNRDLQWSFQGVVYTYKNTDSTLINEQILSPTDALPMDGFGKSIDLQQSRIVIGAPGKDSIRGKVYVYRRIDSTFTPFAAIYPKDNFIPYRLGGDVSIQGNLIAASSIPLQYKNWHLRSVYLNEICGLPAISSDQANPVCPGDSVHLQAGCHKDSVNWYNSSGLLKANSRRYNFIASGKDSIWANIWTKGIF